MNILYVSWDKPDRSLTTSSGAGKVVYNEIEALRQLGDVNVITPPMTTFEEADEFALKQYIANPKKYTLAQFYASSYPKLVKKLKEDGVKTSFTSAAHDIDLSRLAHLELGYAYDYPHLTEGSEIWERYIWCYHNVDVMICPSMHSRDVLLRQGCQRVRVVPHGCYDTVHEVKPISDAFRVGYLGQPLPDKGLLFLISAWGMLNYPDAQLVIAGRNTETLLPLVRQFGKGSIHLAGWIDSPADLYNQISVYCQPSCTEGFACEITEAWCYGRPVIASECAGASYLIENGATGFVSKNRDPRDIADKIDYYKKHPDKIREHGANAKNAVKNYTWDKVREQYVQVWKELLA